MEISVAEAARFLGLSTRTVRRRIDRRELSARKVGSSFRLRLQDLPLSEAQRGQALRALSELRAVVDEALQPPPALQHGSAEVAHPVPPAPTASQTSPDSARACSIRGLKVWQASLELVSGFASERATLPPDLLERLDPAQKVLSTGFELLAVALYQYEPRSKRERLEDARAAFSRAFALISLAQREVQGQQAAQGSALNQAAPCGAAAALLERSLEQLELAVMPDISGLLARLDRTRQGRKAGTVTVS